MGKRTVAVIATANGTNGTFSERKRSELTMPQPTGDVETHRFSSQTATAETTGQPITQIGDAADKPRFRLERGTVWWMGKSYYIGETEAYRILEVLNRRPGWQCHYDLIKQAVWGMPDWDLAEDGALQQLVTTLRRHFKAAGFEGITIDGEMRHHYALKLSVS